MYDTLKKELNEAGYPLLGLDAAEAIHRGDVKLTYTAFKEYEKFIQGMTKLILG